MVTVALAWTGSASFPAGTGDVVPPAPATVTSPIFPAPGTAFDLDLKSPLHIVLAAPNAGTFVVKIRGGDGKSDHGQRIRAVLKANRSKKATKIPLHVVPEKVKTRLFVDYEFLSNVNCDFEREWPNLVGTPMVAEFRLAGISKAG